MKHILRCTLVAVLGLTDSFVEGPLCAQTGSASTAVVSIQPPLHPLPPEEESAGVTKFAFIVYGDTRGRKDGEEIQREHSLVVASMLAEIKKRDSTEFPVRFVLQTGDAVVSGWDPKQWNVSFVGLINRITTEAGVPYFLAPGNHDVTRAPQHDDPNRVQGLRNYLDAVAQLIPPDGAPRRLSGYPTYAFGYGNTFFLALDSNIGADSVQFSWIRSQLEGLDRNRFPNIIVFYHHPAFSSGPHGGPILEPPSAVGRERYLPLFRQHHVRVNFSGHDHLFDHWVERYTDTAGRPYRMDHVVTGGGGAPLYEYAGEPDLAAYLATNSDENVSVQHLAKPSPIHDVNPYHFLVITVDGEQLRLEIFPVDTSEPYAPYGTNSTPLQDFGDER